MQEIVLWLTIIVQILCQFAVQAFNNGTSLTLRRQGQAGGGGGSKALNSFLDYLLPEEGWQCVKGPTWNFFCNDCVCLGGQLYICTWRNCGDIAEKLYFKRQGRKQNRNNKQVANRDTKLGLSTFGMTTNCVEGEDIQSFDSCNRCYCGAGKILCTNQKCSDTSPLRCTPGSILPTPDNCNSCTCNTNGRYICTTVSCGPVLEKNIKRNCKPGIWYSTRGDPHCRECFCLNGIMVLCYVSMCDAGIQQKVDAVFLESPEDLPESCHVGDFIHDKCTKCRCTESRLWSCQSTCDVALSSKKKKNKGLLKGLIKGRKKVNGGSQKLSGGNGYPNSGGYPKGGGKLNGGGGGSYSNGGGGGNPKERGKKGPKLYGQYVEEYDYYDKKILPQSNKAQNDDGYGGFPHDGHYNNHPNGGDFGPNNNGGGGFPNDGHMPNNNYPNGGDSEPNHNGNDGFPNDGHHNNHPNGGDFGPNNNGGGSFPNDGHIPNNNYPDGGDFGPYHNGNGGFPNDDHQPHNNYPNGGDFGPNHNGNGGFPHDGHYNNHPNGGDFGPNNNGGNGLPNDGHMPNNNYPDGGNFGSNHNGNGGFPNDDHQPHNNYPNGGDFGPNHNGNGGFPHDGHYNNHPNGGDFGPNNNGGNGLPNDGHMPNNNYPDGGNFGSNHNGNGGFPNDDHQPHNNYPNDGDFGPNHNGNGGFPHDGHYNNHPNGGDFGPNNNGGNGFPNDEHIPNNNYPDGGDSGPNHNGNGGFPNDGYQPHDGYPNGGDFGPNHNNGFPHDGHHNNHPNDGDFIPNNNGGGSFPNDGHLPNNNHANGGENELYPNGGGNGFHNDGHGPNHGPVTHNGRGPYCLMGQYFTQGNINSCQGCYCSPQNQWKCYSMRGPCRGYVHTKKCSHGKLKKSPSRPCSVCYCGADGTHFCATDEHCAYAIKPTHCEAAACHSFCAESNANMGICQQDKCVCVH